MKPDQVKEQEQALRLPGDQEDGIIISPDTHKENRIPPGQVRTRRWPVLHAGGVPAVDPNTWIFSITGWVENELSLSFSEFQSLPQIKVFADFHCVTTWSRLGNVWGGVSIKTILEKCKPKPEAQYVLATAEEGWTTNIPLSDLDEEDVLLATHHDGEPLTADHGGPVRLIVPRLYAWKSAKWITGLQFLAEDQPGFWEKGGYHMRGEPWSEQRFQ